MKLVVGLGNPGATYARSRHNVGFRCIDHLAAKHGISISRRQAHARVGLGRIDDSEVVLARPLTYMNLSGIAVGPLAKLYRVVLPDLLVVYDDMDLPLGAIRLRERGSAGGHNGMRSIIATVGTQDFPRLRIGIGRPTREGREHVLSNFTEDEEATFQQVLDRAAEAIQCWVTEGIVAAMNRFNR